MIRNRRLQLLGTVLLAAVLSGCATRYSDRTFTKTHELEIHIRTTMRGTRPIERGFGQPVTISAVRLHHILEAVDIETGVGRVTDRRAAIATELLRPISEHLASAFAEAGPNDEILVMAARRKKRLGILHVKYLTTFVTYIKGENLFLHFVKVDEEISKSDEHKKKKFPKPELGKNPDRLHTIPSRGMYQAGQNGVSARWRAETFDKPQRTERLATGEVQRKTVIMDSPVPADELGQGVPSDLIRRLSPETLRALADLEDARKRGDVTEGEYQRRREDLLATAEER